LKSDACDSLFRAAVSPTGTPIPKDTLAAAEFIVRYPWHQPEKLFAVFNDLYRNRNSNLAGCSGRLRFSPI
jgi:hypothetical protein